MKTHFASTRWVMQRNGACVICDVTLLERGCAEVRLTSDRAGELLAYSLLSATAVDTLVEKLRNEHVHRGWVDAALAA